MRAWHLWQVNASVLGDILGRQKPMALYPLRRAKGGDTEQPGVLFRERRNGERGQGPLLMAQNLAEEQLRPF